MEPANGAHSNDPWADEEILSLTAAALPPLSDIGDSSKGNLHLAIPPSSSSSSSSGARDEKQDYMLFSRREIEKLIEGVKQHGRDWEEIMDRYFKKSGRTANQLKEKWRHMLKSADKETNPRLKELYLRAKNVDALYPKRYFRRSSADCEQYSRLVRE